ncbi:MAG: heavy metal translocating P-type ATPase [Candidatus Methanomethylophilaceae archaeon]|nr:heavy metal translocating P-type ATPase [Candidatus Methanomethylophilaceae archaeon]
MKKIEMRMIAGAVIFAIGAVMHFILDSDQYLQLAVFLIGYLIVGYDVILKAARNIGHGQVFDEHFLMVIATAGAFIIGEYPEGMAVMLFFQVGEWFERKAVGRTRESISALVDIQPEYANVIRDGDVEQVDPEEVAVGDLIVVLPGERIPLDGTVVEGSSSVDTKALTGESMPRDITVGTDVISGTINLTSKITVRVTKAYEDSTVTKVLELVEDSVSAKAPTERFITRFARYYTPLVVVCALLVAVIPIALGQDASTWIYRALTFLVVSCPCALVISVPLGYFCGIGAASRLGILVKGGNYLEALGNANTVVFDKTGTLTEGRFEVVRIHPVDCTEEELLCMAAEAESVSNHPLSESIRRAHGKEIGHDRVTESEEMPGKGIRAVIDGRTHHVGNHRLMSEIGVESCPEEVLGTNVHVAMDGKYKGHIVVADVIKDDSRDAVSELRDCGILRTVMLSGDSRKIAEAVGNEIGLDEIHSELLPADKTEILRTIIDSGKGKTVYVGDGINDAPSLAMSDIGIAMGALGSDAAIEAADLVIMDDAPSRIPMAVKLAKRTNRIVRENIVFALGVKFAILILAVLGIADMWVAVFGDVGVSVIAILNSMRCLNVGRYQMETTQTAEPDSS